MHDKQPYQVGLTGGIGSGKSTVARVFQILDVPVYESDEAAKLVYFFPEVRELVIGLLGPEAYLSKTELNSKWIGNTVYSDPGLLKCLNEIIHPEVGEHYHHWLSLQTNPYVVKVAALIFEANIYKNMDFNIMVTAPLDLKIERVLKRDPLRDRQQLEKIISSQLSDEEKKKLTDSIIQNDDSKSIISQVLDLHKVILTKCS